MTEKIFALLVNYPNGAEIQANSIGLRDRAYKAYDNNTSCRYEMSVGVITKEQAIQALMDDILDHDDSGLRHGNTLRRRVSKKLYRRMGGIQ